METIQQYETEGQSDIDEDEGEEETGMMDQKVIEAGEIQAELKVLDDGFQTKIESQLTFNQENI